MPTSLPNAHAAIICCPFSFLLASFLLLFCCQCFRRCSYVRLSNGYRLCNSIYMFILLFFSLSFLLSVLLSIACGVVFVVVVHVVLFSLFCSFVQMYTVFSFFACCFGWRYVLVSTPRLCRIGAHCSQHPPSLLTLSSETQSECRCYSFLSILVITQCKAAKGITYSNGNFTSQRLNMIHA